MVVVTFVPSTTAVSSPASTAVVWLGMVDVKGGVGVVGVLPDKLEVKREVGVLPDRVVAKGGEGVVGVLSDRLVVKREAGVEDVVSRSVLSPSPPTAAVVWIGGVVTTRSSADRVRKQAQLHVQIYLR
jgi:hypothetical protein